jgi:tRNA-2-methylthio-N6-dimethylallyladenosine synthase
MAPLLYIRTFGCQMNVHDSQRIAEIMVREGYELTADPGVADVALVNSCSVREKAWHKAISEAGRLRRRKLEHPQAVVGVVGCVAEQEGARIFDLVPELDLVVGPDRYAQLPAFVSQVVAERQPRVAVGFDDGRPEDFLTALPGSHPGTASSFVTVMKGCEERCAYCIVPTVRGPERFRPAADVVAEVEVLTGDGVKEVTLLGQKVNAYRKPGSAFVDLLEQLDAVARLERLRFTSPHPRFMSADLTGAFGSLRTLCEAIHLPLQSGSDSVLERMGRRYSRSQYLDVVDRLRRACPEVAIYTDLIVGYPGETTAEFEDTLRMIEQVGFNGAFSFKYSPRPGTPAADLKDDVPAAEKSRRLDAVHQVVGAQERAWRSRLVGQRLEVLVDGIGRLPRQLSGRARNNQIVNFVPDNDVKLEQLRGCLVHVDITEAHPHSLAGQVTAAEIERASRAEVVQEVDK